MTELKQCPFCGGEAKTFNPFNVDGTWCVLCSECAAATGFEQTEAEAIAAWNIRTHGTLTAEQIMAIAGKHQPDYCSDTHVCFDWQAIADELNATLGSGTCENLAYYSLINFECSVCGCEVSGGDELGANIENGHWNFCPNCGRKVTR